MPASSEDEQTPRLLESSQLLLGHPDPAIASPTRHFCMQQYHRLHQELCAYLLT